MGLETYLRCFSGEQPLRWANYLPWAELCYNSSYHSTIKMTPFKAVYGREPPALLRYESGSTTNADLEKRLTDKDATLTLLKEHLERAQQAMKASADKHRRAVCFEVGDLVYLKMRPYRLRSLARKLNKKLSTRFYGPYPVEARVGPVAYRLHLPPEARIHPTFHVSQLKAAVGDTVQSVDKECWK